MAGASGAYAGAMEAAAVRIFSTTRAKVQIARAYAGAAIASPRVAMRRVDDRARQGRTAAVDADVVTRLTGKLGAHCRAAGRIGTFAAPGDALLVTAARLGARQHAPAIDAAAIATQRIVGAGV